MFKKYNIAIHTILLSIISISLFTLYSFSNKYLNSNTSDTIYILGMTIYGFFILLCFLFSKNSFYGVSSFIITFLFCEKGFTSYYNMSLLTNLFILSLLGFIIHLFKYKPHLYLGHYTLSTIIFLFSISLSGLFVKEYDSIFQVSTPWFMLPLVLLLGLSLILLLNYFECTNESSIYDISIYFKSFIILILYEFLFYLIFDLNFDINLFFQNKHYFNGIGSPNTVAIILQLTIPFMLYFSFKYHKLINSIFFYLNYLLIILTMSRGAIFITTLLSIIYYIYLFIRNKTDYKNNLLYHIPTTITFILFILIFTLTNKEAVSSFNKIMFSNLNQFNGREPLWRYVLEHWSINPIFGIGIVSNSYWHLDNFNFQFAHSTILHTLFMTGLLGLLGLFIHLLDKYTYIYKTKKYTSLFIMFYLYSGIYGLIDVTYYNIHYTLILLVIMYFYSSYINNTNKDSIFNLFSYSNDNKYKDTILNIY